MHRLKAQKNKKTIASRLIGSPYAMVSSILRRETSYKQIKSTERSIKSFLSCVNQFDEVNRRNKDDIKTGVLKPIWWSRHNFRSS